MKKSKKLQPIFLSFLTAACLISTPAAVMAETEDKPVFVETGFLSFPWDTLLPRNAHTQGPLDEDFLTSSYYAPGYGIEVHIESTDQGEYLTLKNYNTSELSELYIELVNNQGYIEKLDTDCTLTRISDTELQIEFSNPSLIYKNASSVTLTRLDVLSKQKPRNNWEGLYRWYDVYDDDRVYYYSMVPIYDTGDYIMVSQNFYYQVQQEGDHGKFLVENKEDHTLEYVTPYSVVTETESIFGIKKEENGDLLTNIYGEGDGSQYTYELYLDRLIWFDYKGD